MIAAASRGRAGAAIVALLVTCATAGAEPVPVPSQEDWAGAKQRAATGTGVELAYVRMGAEEGQPIVLIHGYSDNSRSWSLVALQLPSRPLYAVDLRGHGKSDAPPCCYGADTMAADVAGLMEALGSGRTSSATPTGRSPRASWRRLGRRRLTNWC